MSTEEFDMEKCIAQLIDAAKLLWPDKSLYVATYAVNDSKGLPSHCVAQFCEHDKALREADGLGKQEEESKQKEKSNKSRINDSDPSALFGSAFFNDLEMDPEATQKTGWVAKATVIALQDLQGGTQEVVLSELKSQTRDMRHEDKLVVYQNALARFPEDRHWMKAPLLKAAVELMQEIADKEAKGKYVFVADADGKKTAEPDTTQSVPPKEVSWEMYQEAVKRYEREVEKRELAEEQLERERSKGNRSVDFVFRQDAEKPSVKDKAKYEDEIMNLNYQNEREQMEVKKKDKQIVQLQKEVERLQKALSEKEFQTTMSQTEFGRHLKMQKSFELLIADQANVHAKRMEESVLVVNLQARAEELERELEKAKGDGDDRDYSAIFKQLKKKIISLEARIAKLTEEKEKDDEETPPPYKDENERAQRREYSGMSFAELLHKVQEQDGSLRRAEEEIRRLTVSLKCDESAIDMQEVFERTQQGHIAKLNSERKKLQDEIKALKESQRRDLQRIDARAKRAENRNKELINVIRKWEYQSETGQKIEELKGKVEELKKKLDRELEWGKSRAEAFKENIRVLVEKLEAEKLECKIIKGLWKEEVGHLKNKLDEAQKRAHLAETANAGVVPTVEITQPNTTGATTSAETTNKSSDQDERSANAPTTVDTQETPPPKPDRSHLKPEAPIPVSSSTRISSTVKDQLTSTMNQNACLLEKLDLLLQKQPTDELIATQGEVSKLKLKVENLELKASISSTKFKQLEEWNRYQLSRHEAILQVLDSHVEMTKKMREEMNEKFEALKAVEEQRETEMAKVIKEEKEEKEQISLEELVDLKVLKEMLTKECEELEDRVQVLSKEVEEMAEYSKLPEQTSCGEVITPAKSEEHATTATIPPSTTSALPSEPVVNSSIASRIKTRSELRQELTVLETALHQLDRGAVLSTKQHGANERAKLALEIAQKREKLFRDSLRAMAIERGIADAPFTGATVKGNGRGMKERLEELEKSVEDTRRSLMADGGEEAVEKEEEVGEEGGKAESDNSDVFEGIQKRNGEEEPFNGLAAASRQNTLSVAQTLINPYAASESDSISLSSTPPSNSPAEAQLSSKREPTTLKAPSSISLSIADPESNPATTASQPPMQTPLTAWAPTSRSKLPPVGTLSTHSSKSVGLGSQQSTLPSEDAFKPSAIEMPDEDWADESPILTPASSSREFVDEGFEVIHAR